MEEDLKLELESCPQTEPVFSLESSLSSCPVCQIGELKEVKREGKTQMIIYTRDGTKLAEHKEKRCNNKSCRIGAFYGAGLDENNNDKNLTDTIMEGKSKCCWELFLLDNLQRFQIFAVDKW